jgi:hypothetical protein
MSPMRSLRRLTRPQRWTSLNSSQKDSHQTVTIGSRGKGPAGQGGVREATMSEVTEHQLEDMEALFVQTAASMTSDRETITLHGLSPSTLYFADRPKREVGHMSSAHFVANWPEGDNSFAG